jgi:2-C-methyl-D-erythritol 4-phosphate cytidylyltransferase
LPRDVGVLLVAGGRGERAGAGPLKQFRELAGVPLLLRALRPFARHPEVTHVVIALPAEHAAPPPAWLAEVEGPAVTLVAGGSERTESVRLALAALPTGAAIVLVHDAARPFVSEETISAVIAAARETGAALAAVPLADTLKEADASGQEVKRTLPRQALWRAQTPQGFRREVLEAAHAAGAAGATDDAMLVEATGATVRLVPDSSLNFKVTTGDDLALAEAWAARTS